MLEIDKGEIMNTLSMRYCVLIHTTFPPYDAHQVNSQQAVDLSPYSCAI